MKGRAKGVRTPNQGTVALLAGEYLYKNGPAQEHDLLLAGNTQRASEQRAAIQHAASNGWLIVVDGGRFDCSAAARAYFDRLAGKAPAQKPMGKIAESRQMISAYDRPPLSKKHIPNPRGTRQDVPAWSVRATPSFHTKA